MHLIGPRYFSKNEDLQFLGFSFLFSFPSNKCYTRCLQISGTPEDTNLPLLPPFFFPSYPLHWAWCSSFVSKVWHNPSSLIGAYHFNFFYSTYPFALLLRGCPRPLAWQRIIEQMWVSFSWQQKSIHMTEPSSPLILPFPPATYKHLEDHASSLTFLVTPNFLALPPAMIHSLHC